MLSARTLATFLVLALASGAGAGLARAQHDAHSPATHATGDTEEPPAPHHGVLGIPMARHGSGTAWLPDASPMRGARWRLAGWDVMVHGNVFAGYDYQSSDAGEGRAVSQNWLMAMAGHPLAGGTFEARTMLSLEPLTVGEEGYPLLLQTGETADGMPLVDRQHAHDLWMELAARYDRALSDDVAFELYTALAGEPAVGPVAFPHRPSAMSDPMAPLGHHWLDSTHISFGVVTAGVFTRTAKLEGSWFNGREPDEERFDLDLAPFDSYAGRLSINPDPAWSVQASYAFLESPEVLEPEVSVQRITGSAIHARPWGDDHAWTSSAAVGVNVPSEGHTTYGFLVESALDLGHVGVSFVRGEHVVKSGHDFALPPAMEDVDLPITSLSLGHVHPIAEVAGTDAGVGVRASIAYAPPELETRYGTRTPVGVMAFVQVQPTRMHH